MVQTFKAGLEEIINDTRSTRLGHGSALCIDGLQNDSAEILGVFSPHHVIFQAEIQELADQPMLDMDDLEAVRLFLDERGYFF